MNDIAAERPSFFEGEVIGAADLEQIMVYVREQSARHLLGGHTWGIVAGLQLLEQTAPSGAIDVYLLPGYGIDGYGRAVVVVNPLRLDVAWFNGQPTGPTQVWIRYDQGATRGVRPGFQVCCGDNDAFSRVAESYEVEVGNLSLAKQQSGISIAGEAIADARTASRMFDDAGPVICDGSVPYQDMPLADDTRSRWLIPLGEVGWQPGTPGQFVTLVDSDPTKVLHSRRLRRYAGVVGENFYAADGLIRLRRRESGVAGIVDQKVIDAACGSGDLADPSHDDDLENCADGPTPTELVWVEGRMRVTDDVRVLAPGRLELRNAKGTSYFPPTAKGSAATFLQRTDHQAGPANNADLAVVIGKAATGNNRFLIQEASEPQEPTPCQAVQFATLTTRVAVLDNGNVGIGTDAPDQLLTVANAGGDAFIHLHDGDVLDLYLGAGEFGGVFTTANTNDLRFRTGGTDPTDDAQTRMTIVSTGQVGIGTTTPDPGHNITLHGKTRASLIARTEDPHEVLVAATSAGALVASNTAGDDLRLGADEAEPYVWIKANGRVGVHHSNPAYNLDVVANTGNAELRLAAPAGAANRHMLVGAEDAGVYAGSHSEHDFRLKTFETTKMIVKVDGKVGIGTESPTQTLDVRGPIKLGYFGQYYATGGHLNWAMVPGVVNAVGSSSGAGWTSTHNPSTSDYKIEFTTAFFVNPPIVTVTLVGSGSSGVMAMITAADAGGFTIELSSGEHAFHFIAIAER